MKELSKEEQQQNLAEKAFMLKIKVKPSALPKVAYYVECFTCHKVDYIHLAKKQTLTNEEITAYLVANGWHVGQRGYECPDCVELWADAVVAYVTGEDHPPIVEGSLEDV